MVCRLCLKDDSSIASVVKLYRNSELNVIEGLEMARLVEKYLDIEVTHDDAISTIICSECHGHLKEFHKFRKNVEEKQETLQSECVQVKNEVPVSVSFVEANDDDCDRIVPDTWELEDESCDYIMEIVKTEDEKEGNDQNLFDDCQNNGKSEESNKNVFSSDVHSSGAMHDMLKCIQKHIEGQTQGVHEFRREIRSQNQFFASELFEIKMCLHEILEKNEEKKKMIRLFPIETEEALDDLECKLNDKNDKVFNDVVKKIIQRGGILKNFHNLFSEAIIKDFNFDGSQGKKSFRSYRNINELLFSATECDTFDIYKDTVKRAFRLEKNKLYKAKCIEVKQRELTAAKSIE
ncbi:uncharacterized protein LOC142228791 isoform X2 [Haematobia irritans]|uniref:uncharacterized protein LOC142228791 isoform X2 n=1 Tax=Haematobia irritans TaxID=7368 RepID=UPI003F508736